MDWLTLLKDLGVFSGFVLAITYLLKTLGKHFMDQNLKIHEMQLNQQLQKHKSELDLVLQKALKLHDHRLEKIQQFYHLLVEFHIDINQLIMIKNVTGKTDEEIKQMKIEEVKKMYESGHEFSVFYQKNKLFFSKETCKLIDELLQIMKSSQFDLSIQYQWMNLSFDLIHESFQKGKEKIESIIPKLKEQLEDNFRNILGVE
jgi:hypothetical protein